MIRPGQETREMIEQQTAAAYSASRRGAWVAAVFCVLVLGLLVGNRVTLSRVDPLNHVQLGQMKARLAKNPKDAALQQRIRTLDLHLRREYMTRLAFANQGGYVLLVGVGLFLIAGASALHYRKQLPVPGPEEADAASVRRMAGLARRSVAVFGAVAVLGLAGLAVFSGDDFTGEYAAATRGYKRVVAKVKKPAGAVEMPAPVPPGPAASSSGSAVAPVPQEIPPLPIPGIPPGSAENTEGQPGQETGGETAEPEEPKPAPVKIDTVPFDESDYKPAPEDWAANWPIFRGPNGMGYIESGDFPVEWNGETGEGILWKTPLPLPGWNSPLVWGDRVFIAGADKDKREIYCLDAQTGKLLWAQQVAMLTGQVDVMDDTGYAPSTMAVDGKRVFAIFPNGDLACLDFDGKQLWTKALGNPENMYGHASSLTMHGSLLMVLFDQGSGGDDSKSLLLALQGGTGNCVWFARRDVPNSWATPLIVNTGTRLELITSANPWVISYDAVTGRELWRASVLGGDVAPTPVFAAGKVLACNTGAVLAAIKPGEGDITETNVLWRSYDGLPDITSPAASNDLVFLADSMGTVTCVDLETGEKVWDHYFEVPFQASPTVVGNRVYLPDHDGTTHIITAGRTFVEEHKPTLPEHISATPAFVNGRIYIRGEKHVYCVGAK